MKKLSIEISRLHTRERVSDQRQTPLGNHARVAS